jgi:hypothetical protein
MHYSDNLGSAMPQNAALKRPAARLNPAHRRVRGFGDRWAEKLAVPTA